MGVPVVLGVAENNLEMIRDLLLPICHEDSERFNIGRGEIPAVRSRYHSEQDAVRLHTALRRVGCPAQVRTQN